MPLGRRSRTGDPLQSRQYRLLNRLVSLRFSLSHPSQDCLGQRRFLPLTHKGPCGIAGNTTK